MIGPWMLYVLLLTGVLGLAALALERVFQRAGRPVRGLWAGAMAASVLLPPARAIVACWSEAGAGLSVGEAEGLGASSGVARVLVAGPLSPSVLERGLLFGWVAASLALLCVLLISAAALRRDRRSWSSAALAGTPVFLTEAMGPAVVGFWRPSIVLPRWVLSWDEPLQGIIIAHEREHIRAGDPLLLLGALAALLVMPWNLPLWWQFRRLRLAIEIDCDGRVLRGPISSREYGVLLLDVARMPRHRRLAVAAFAESDAGLDRRIRLLARPRGHARSAAGATVGGLVLLLPLAMHAGVPAPSLPAPSYLLRVAAPAGALRTPQGPTNAGLLPPPGSPTPSELTAAVRRHHAAALERGLPPKQAIWFVADAHRRVLHTGVATGSAEEIRSAVAARHPVAAGTAMLYFRDRESAGGLLRVVWLLPPVDGSMPAPAPEGAAAR